MDASTTTEQPRHRTLADTIAVFEEREGLFNADLDVSLKSLRMTEAGTIAVPDGREFALNTWSRDQLATMTGVRWDRWFEAASPNETAEELNRRFVRGDRAVRLRTASPEVGSSHGVLRALVSPTYSAIPDSLIARDVATALRADPRDLRVLRTSVTEMSSTLVLAVGEPFRRGDGGRVGDVRGSLTVRNSDVGYSSLVVIKSLHRLVCTNGMSLPEPDAVVLRKAHRGLDRNRIFASLTAGLTNLPARLHRAVGVLERSADHRIDDIEREVRQVLEDAHLPLKLVTAVLAAYAREPHMSAFGVGQALTLSAQSETPEVRFDLERAAGSYLSRTMGTA